MMIKPGFYYVGVQDPQLRHFDIIMHTPYGTSYNAYVYTHGNTSVLFDTVKHGFIKPYFEQIESTVDTDTIKYLIVSHSEPDHAGSIQAVLDRYPTITLVMSMVAYNFVKNQLNHDFNHIIVKDHDTLDIDGSTIEFYSVPNLHWPDTIYSYIHDIHTLVTCDSFGAHYSFDGLLKSKLEDTIGYQAALDYYTTMIMGPFKPFILKAMDKISGLTIDCIAPGHGPVLDQDIEQTIDYYKTFASSTNHNHEVLIAYVSCYGYTKKIAELLEHTIASTGLTTHLIDLEYANMDETIQLAKDCDAILYGSPTILNDALPPIYTLINSIIPGYDGTKVCSAFGSYGWSGEAVGHIITRLKQQRHRVIDNGLKICFAPSDSDIETIKTYGLTIANEVKKIQ